MLTTECISEKVKLPTTSSLPAELTHMVVEFAIQNTRRTKNGRALCKLMHVSRALRAKVAKAFEPVTLYECTSDVGAGTLLIARQLTTYIHEAASHHFLDFSLKRRLGLRPKIPLCHTTITATAGETFNFMICTVCISASSFALPSGSRAEREEREESDERLYKNGVKVIDACKLLESTMAQEDLRESVRFANIFQRSLGRNPLAAPTARVEVTVNLALADSEDDGIDDETVDRYWRFFIVP